MLHALRSSISAGRRYYDFMLGAEDYKYAYGASDRCVDSFILESDRPRSRGVRAVGLAMNRLW